MPAAIDVLGLLIRVVRRPFRALALEGGPKGVPSVDLLSPYVVPPFLHDVLDGGDGRARVLFIVIGKTPELGEV